MNNKKKIDYFGKGLNKDEYKPSFNARLTDLCCWIADRFHLVLMLVAAIAVLPVMLKGVL